jgi:uncharacterized protein YukE
MPQGYGVTTETVATGSGNAADLAINGLTTSQTMINKLNETIWRGAGGDAFTGKLEEMRADLMRINNALGWLADRLGGAGVKYDSNDVETQGVVMNSTGGLGSIGTNLRQG